MWKKLTCNSTHSHTQSPLAMVCCWLTDLSRSWPALIIYHHGASPHAHTQNDYLHFTPSPLGLCGSTSSWYTHAHTHTTWAVVSQGWSCLSSCCIMRVSFKCQTQPDNFIPSTITLLRHPRTSIYSRLKAEHSSINTFTDTDQHRKQKHSYRQGCAIWQKYHITIWELLRCTMSFMM